MSTSAMDQYDRRARLMPTLLIILPVALAVLALAGRRPVRDDLGGGSRA